MSENSEKIHHITEQNMTLKLLAFDLDGTLTQHRSPLDEKNRAILDRLRKKYRLLMIGAGACMRIFKQMNEYPIDIIGNYGMQVAQFNKESGALDVIENIQCEFDRERTIKVCAELRQKYGFTKWEGDAVEFHASGMITFPLLGTKAKIEDKLAFDPDRSRRKIMFEDVKKAFPGSTVFIGGSSSFDVAPFPFNKLYALERYYQKLGLTSDEVAYVGDDYRTGGNDEQIYRSNIRFFCVDNYRKLDEVLAEIL